MDSEPIPRLLGRQLKRTLAIPDGDALAAVLGDLSRLAAGKDVSPQLKAALTGLTAFIHSVADAYRQSERDLELSRRSLDISSQELFAANASLRNARGEAELRAAELQAILNSMPIPVFVKNREGCYTGCNPAFEGFFGRPRSFFIGKSVFEIAPPDLAREYQTKDNELFRSGTTQVYESQVRRADGALRDVIFHKATYAGPDGSVAGLIGGILDITERKQAEVEMRKLSRAAEYSPETIVITDAQGRIEYVNPAFVKITGYSVEEALGQTPRLLKSGQHTPDFYKDLWATIQTGQVWHGEFCNRKKNGDLYWEAAAIAPILDAQGAIINFVGIKEDISGQKEIAEQLRHAVEAAESANQAKSDFLASMSHELRTPLNAIIGFSEVLADQTFGELNPKQSKYVGNVLEAGRHLLSLINDILDLSKVEAGKMICAPESVRVHALLADALVMVKERAAKNRLNLTLDAPDDLTVQADPRMLKQIMFNLLSNAVKFTPPGGSIMVEAERYETDLWFTVADTGIGIKPADRERIFEAFEQVDSSHARKHQGTGLGLALVKKFVELHGGRVWVESSGEGQGSVFRFTLPMEGRVGGQVHG